MKRIFLILISILAAGQLIAQDVKYEGQVLSAEDKQPLVGASVIIQGTSVGAITDAQGNFSLSGPRDARLTISFIGFMPLENVRMEPGKRLTYTLMVDATTLDEVVVVGYGTVRKSEVTTASSGIRAEDMKTEGITSFEQSLQGKLSGVVVINTEGAPGSAISMEIRGVTSISGSSEPLYVIDGMPVESDDGMSATMAGQASTQNFNPMASLNPNDIESIEVLKDASARAIYGSRGANGVVMITTKAGRIGKARVTVDYNSNFSKITKFIPMMSAREYADYRIWAQSTPINPNLYTPEQYASFGDDPYRWQRLIYRVGNSHEYSASVSGGQKAFTYMISGNFYDQEGIVINTGFHRMSLRGNFNFELSPKVKMSWRNSLSRVEYQSLASSTGANDVNQQGIIKQALRFQPTAKRHEEIYDENEDEDVVLDGDGSRRNPYVEATRPQRITANNSVRSYLSLEAKLHKNLSFLPSAGIDYNISRGDSYYPPDTQQGRPTDNSGTNAGLGSIRYVETLKWIVEPQLVYTNTWLKKHNLTATGVFSMEKITRPKLAATVQDLMEELGNNHLQDGNSETYVINSDRVDRQLVSWVGRAAYSYNSRYFLTASIRADGSSVFGKNHKWGYFPAVSARWNLNNEKFTQGVVKALKMDVLALRISWGQVGNQAIPPYQSLSMVGTRFYPTTNGPYKTLYLTSPSNPDLKWETTAEWNYAIDLSLFDRKFDLTVNAYSKITFDLLQESLIPPSTGYPGQRLWMNNGEIRNRGLEFEARARILNKKDFQWRLDGNISFNRNEILALAGGVTEQFPANIGNGGTSGYTPFIQKVGYSLGTLWGYKTDGIYQTLDEVYADGLTGSTYHSWIAEEETDATTMLKMVGERRLVDTNGDKIINSDDRVKNGDVNPDFTFGVTNTFTWKKLNLLVLVTGKVGGDIYNQFFTDLEMLTGYSNYTRESYRNRWQGAGTSNTYPKLRKIADPRLYDSIDTAVEDGTYVRLKTVKLSYSFNKSTWRPAGTIWASCDNILTFTGYRGYDPEVSSYGQRAALRGIDLGAYPQSRTFQFGVSLNF